MDAGFWSTFKNSIKTICCRKQFGIQTFTYHIPSPPERRSGYREKEFDSYIRNLTMKGYKIISIHTEQSKTGMWIISLARGEYSMDAQDDLHESVEDIS